MSLDLRIQVASITWNRMTTCVFTLFTFCPPAPDERVKVNSSLSSGIAIFWGTVKLSFDEKNLL